MVYIIGQGGTGDPVALQTQTRKRRQIGNEVRPEKAPESLREGVRIITDAYPDVEPLSATALYNCYGLAFASRRSWIIDETEVQKVLADDDFRDLGWDARLWASGDIVLYYSGEELSHVAVITDKRANIETGEVAVRVVSAWGESGEYLHLIDRVSPLLGKPCRVVSQRKKE
jgi:hypothetical protein